MEWTLQDDLRLERLNRLLAAVGFPRSHAQFADFPPGRDGATGWIGRDPYAAIAIRLPDVEAEVTLLHEAAHWRLGHEEPGSGYAAARQRDEDEGTDHHRAPFEHAANDLAREWMDEHVDLLTDLAASKEALNLDDTHYSA
jgi:hypothetical protein